ncbi:MarR family winged helix-turn-helix transcriptional regulator [Streptomyces sp. NBC_00576]|uniref:MarR family winged helix-turn-helix transcriptional regulator n=1 Tax=Streptomyces sp. NBC_00576 TaxID=2903665 RepID=UPI002E8164A4|nr:MarR family winged helix-turn-helix transcriptional regulator [Streptomyces sp. NBC_00576]WUB71771.1 MarR family transcriptional regulator [Streptomyces sp. NBC_00576]
MPRDDRTAGLELDSRRYVASYVLFNQAVADHLGMHPTDVQCLSLLGIEPGPFTTGRIAELTGLTSGSATRLVDRLERAGYVTRQRDEEDRRRVLVVPVAAAMRRLGEFWDSLAEGWLATFEGYTEQELALLGRHMRRTTELAQRQIEYLRALPTEPR